MGLEDRLYVFLGDPLGFSWRAVLAIFAKPVDTSLTSLLGRFHFGERLWGFGGHDTLLCRELWIEII